MGLLELLHWQSRTSTANAAPVLNTTPVATRWPKRAIAQLVGANVTSTMFDPGYGLEKSLPPLLAQSPDGRPLKAFKSITGGDGKFVAGERVRFDRAHLRNLTLSFQFIVSYYGQDVEGFNMFMWNGVRMNGLPVIAGFTAERTEAEARDLWLNEAYLMYGLTSKPNLTVASGTSGWVTLAAALERIASPEGKVVWESGVDIPSYPKEKLPNEGATLLMLAHPAYESGRKPLVYFGAPVAVPVAAAKRQPGETARVAALRESAARACEEGGLEPGSLLSLATDCGRTTPEAAKRLGEVGAALHEIAPQLDVARQRIDMAALLGELGANTVNWTLIMAAYAAYERNHPVLYLSNVDPDAGRAMLVHPTPGHVPPSPARTFREHSNRGQYYAPWWGQRLDGKKDY